MARIVFQGDSRMSPRHRHRRASRNSITASRGPFDLFGCDRDRPFARIDKAGLLRLLDADQLVALTAETATSRGAPARGRPGAASPPSLAECSLGSCRRERLATRRARGHGAGPCRLVGMAPGARFGTPTRAPPGATPHRLLPFARSRGRDRRAANTRCRRRCKLDPRSHRCQMGRPSFRN